MCGLGDRCRGRSRVIWRCHPSDPGTDVSPRHPCVTSDSVRRRWQDLYTRDDRGTAAGPSTWNVALWVVRTDNLSAATHDLKNSSSRAMNARYEAVLTHYGVESTRTNPRSSHENGVVEQGHRRLKNALDQALILRGQPRLRVRGRVHRPALIGSSGHRPLHAPPARHVPPPNSSGNSHPVSGAAWSVKGGEILGHVVSMVRINVRLSGQHKCHWYWWR